MNASPSTIAPAWRDVLRGASTTRHLPHAPAADPAAVAARCWRWLRANVDRFHPAVAGRLPQFSTFPEGPAIELLLLCRQQRQEARDVLPVLHAALSDPASDERMYRQPGLFRYHMLRYGLLAETGYEGPSPVSALAALDFGADAAHERSPQTLFELRYAMDLNGVPHRFGPVEEQARGTVIGRPWDWAQLTEPELYAITHALLYTTDFGRRQPPDQPEPKHIEMLLAAVLRADNLDLVGEFLMCLTTLRRRETPIMRLAWSQLAARQLDCGAVPGPAFDPDRTQLSVPYLFTTCYHTTITTALAAGGIRC